MDSKDFLKAICPICKKQYVYVATFKPKTCGKYECVYAAYKDGTIPGYEDIAREMTE